MKIFYSPSTGGFYFDNINKDIPSDGIEITQAEHSALIAGENEIALGPSGKPETKPSSYHTLKDDGSDWEITADNQAKKDSHNAEVDRLSEIESEQEISGLKKISVDQAHAKIDQIFAGATTVEQVKSGVIIALKKMMPYILR